MTYDETLDETDEHFAAAPTQQHSEVLADLETLCRNLPARQREMLSLRYRLGPKTSKIARATRRRQEPVRKLATAAWLSRCLAELPSPPVLRPPQPCPTTSSSWPPRSMGRLTAVLLDRFAGIYRGMRTPVPARRPLCHLSVADLATYRIHRLASRSGTRSNHQALSILDAGGR